MHALEERMGAADVSDDEQAAMLDRYARAEDRFRLADGYTSTCRWRRSCGAGVLEGGLRAAAETFSGGWQMRIALAKLLLERPALLLLDEPTNHLDLDARNWLESYLREYPHAVILVSHDRFFLDSVVTRIGDLNLRTITDYHGNYSDYLGTRRADRAAAHAKKEQDDEVARIKMFVDRFRYQATKAAQVQSRIKPLEKVVPIEVPPERKRVHFTFPAAPKSGRMVHRAEARREGVRRAHRVREPLAAHRARRSDCAGRPQRRRQVHADADALGRRNARQRRAAPGPPGGAGVLRPGRGDPPRPGADGLRDAVDGSPMHMVPAIRNILGGFLFSGDDVYKKAGVLSGGERTRLAVARMLLRPSNLLLLDEPTNHLDLDSKDVLLDALVDYGGTLIFVSHDRYFVERLATRIIEVGHGARRVVPGHVPGVPVAEGARADPPAPGRANESRRREGTKARRPSRGRRPRSRRLPRRSRPKAGPQPAARPRRDADHKAALAEQRKREKDRKTRQARVADLETRIAAHETAIKALEAEMSAPGFYEQREAAQAQLTRHQTLMWEVGELMQQWEMLSETDESGEIGDA